MPYRSFRPSPELSPAVSDLWVQENHADARHHDFAPTRVLPSGGVTVAFYYFERFQEVTGGQEPRLLPRATVTGPQTTFKEYAATGRTGIVLIRFRPGRAIAYLGVPLREFTDLDLDLADIIGRAPVGSVLSRLDAASSTRERVDVISAHVAGRLAAGASVPSIAGLVDDLQVRVRPPSVSEVARLTGCSVRSLQRRFGKYVGLSPKRFCRVQRLQAALRVHQAANSWSRTAFESGYQDQAHLVHDCRLLAGLTPVQLVKRAEGTRLGAHFNDYGGDATAAVTYL